MMAIVDMLHVNTVIQEIELSGFYVNKEDSRIHDKMIRPLLETNAIRARIRAEWNEVAANSDTTETEVSP
jgi:hypothetical protein